MKNMKSMQSEDYQSMYRSDGATTRERPFITYTVKNDIILLRTFDIVYFRFNSERKLWEVSLANNPTLTTTLKKGTNANTILQYSPSFVQIHQSYIININYLKMIENNYCIMYPPFDNIRELTVSKSFRKRIQELFIEI